MNTHFPLCRSVACSVSSAEKPPTPPPPPPLLTAVNPPATLGSPTLRKSLGRRRRLETDSITRGMCASPRKMRPTMERNWPGSAATTAGAASTATAMTALLVATFPRPIKHAICSAVPLAAKRSTVDQAFRPKKTRLKWWVGDCLEEKFVRVSNQISDSAFHLSSHLKLVGSGFSAGTALLVRNSPNFVLCSKRLFQ